MINLVVDGIWCNRCKKFHPTLMWHEKYGQGETDAGMIAGLKNNAKVRPKLFGLSEDMDEDEKARILDGIIEMNLRLKQIYDTDVGECVICGCLTTNASKKTGRHVCSDECLYKENGWGEEGLREIDDTGDDSITIIKGAKKKHGLDLPIAETRRVVQFEEISTINSNIKVSVGKWVPGPEEYFVVISEYAGRNMWIAQNWSRSPQGEPKMLPPVFASLEEAVQYAKDILKENE